MRGRDCSRQQHTSSIRQQAVNGGMTVGGICRVQPTYTTGEEKSRAADAASSSTGRHARPFLFFSFALPVSCFCWLSQ